MASRWKRHQAGDAGERLSPAHTEAEARRLAVCEWAQSLIGLESAEAEQRVIAQGYVARGYHVVVVPSGAPLAADADPGRIRLVVDQHGRVKGAGAG